jgi:SSS family solute:Na+ symporter
MLSVIFFSVIGLSVLIALAARLGSKNMTISEFLVGGRSFPAWLLYFLAVGEIYSIGTMIGLPSGVYAHGARDAVWFLGYILLAYPLGYFGGPLIWRAGVRYNAMTIPDVFGSHFRSRTLEVVTAVALLVALVPWGQYQFIGLQVVLGALGLPISPTQSVVLAGVIAFLYLVVSGVRSPAFVAILKDLFMLVGIVVVGVFAAYFAGGVAPIFDQAHIPQSMTTLSGSSLVFTMSTILVQSITFYLGFSAAFLFTAKSERAIKSSTVWMPMYMLMYPFLIVASFYAISAYPNLANANTVFMKVTTDLLPPWLVGIVAAGAGLSGLLVLATTSLVIGGTVTRNLVPNVHPNTQKRVSNVVIAVFLVIAAWLTLSGSTLMLTVLNLTYYLLGQLVPGWIALMFFKRVKAWAVSTGMIVGLIVAIAFYVTKPDLGGINAGLIAVLVNLVLMFGLSLFGERVERQPMCSWFPATRQSAEVPANGQATFRPVSS